MPAAVKITWNEPIIGDMLSAQNGTVGRNLAVRAQRVQDGARAYLVPHNKTGRLSASITKRWGPSTGTTLSIQVGSWTCPYALFVHDGTEPHLIRPNKKQALFWEGAPHPVKLVHHPGTKPIPFLTASLHLATDD